MCDFISWIEFEGKNYWLTNECLLTKDGKALRKFLGPKFTEDIKGHGACAEYWNLKQNGTHKECTDFSSPDNFPAEIVRDIKAGNLSYIGYDLGLLNDKGQAEYQKVKGPAWAEYLKVTGPAEAEYLKVKGQARAEYEKVYLTSFWKIFKVKKNRAKGWK